MGELTGGLRNVDSKLTAPRNVESGLMTYLLAKTSVMLHGLPAHMLV